VSQFGAVDVAPPAVQLATYWCSELTHNFSMALIWKHSAQGPDERDNHHYGSEAEPGRAHTVT